MPFSALDVFNTLVPKDIGSQRLHRDVEYGQGDRRRLDIYAPRGQIDLALPVVIFFYGGSWESGSKDAYGFVGRALAALGYLVVIPDYRLLPEVEYPVFLEDCAEAVTWVSANINRYGGDFTRMVLSGHSAGAYNAVMLALSKHYLAESPIIEGVRGIAGLSGPYDFYPFDGPISRRVFGAAPEPELTQPINYVDGKPPKMWFGTGAKDRLVLPRNSEKLASALGKIGVDAQVTHYRDLGHADTLLALSTVLRFRAPVLKDFGTFLARSFLR